MMKAKMCYTICDLSSNHYKVNFTFYPFGVNNKYTAQVLGSTPTSVSLNMLISS